MKAEAGYSAITIFSSSNNDKRPARGQWADANHVQSSLTRDEGMKLQRLKLRRPSPPLVEYSRDREIHHWQVKWPWEEKYQVPGQAL
jgi:hypothetical protein